MYKKKIRCNVLIALVISGESNQAGTIKGTAVPCLYRVNRDRSEKGCNSRISHVGDSSATSWPRQNASNAARTPCL